MSNKKRISSNYPSKSAFFALSAMMLGTAFGLSACNSDGAQSQTSADNGSGVTQNDLNPAPAPTSTSTPAPVPTSTPSPKPTASASPLPPASSLFSGAAELEPYVEKFVGDSVVEGRDVLSEMGPDLEIQISSLAAYGSSTIGLCETGGTTRRVTFSPTYWNSVSEDQRQILVHHELGHCVLYQAHRSGTLANGAYSSIMNPIILPLSDFNADSKYYLDELFHYGMSSNATSKIVNAQPKPDADGITRTICGPNEL